MKLLQKISEDAKTSGMHEYSLYADNLPVFDYKSKDNKVYLVTNAEVDIEPITFSELSSYIVQTQLPFSLVELKTEDEEVEWKAEYDNESKRINILFTPF